MAKLVTGLYVAKINGYKAFGTYSANPDSHYYMHYSTETGVWSYMRGDKLSPVEAITIDTIQLMNSFVENDSWVLKDAIPIIEENLSSVAGRLLELMNIEDTGLDAAERAEFKYVKNRHEFEIAFEKAFGYAPIATCEYFDMDKDDEHDPYMVSHVNSAFSLWNIAKIV